MDESTKLFLLEFENRINQRFDAMEQKMDQKLKQQKEEIITIMDQKLKQQKEDIITIMDQKLEQQKEEIITIMDQKLKQQEEKIIVMTNNILDKKIKDLVGDVAQEIHTLTDVLSNSTDRKIAKQTKRISKAIRQAANDIDRKVAS